MLILYGSETGTAQDVAESIWREAKRRIAVRRRRQITIYCMDDFDDIRGLFAADDGGDEDGERRVVIFVCSTTGQGDVPGNMKHFWRLLCRRSLPSDALGHLSVAVLGLGDSSYQKFNFAAKKLYRRLIQLGANPLLPLGLADDQHDLGYDAVVENWTQDLWTILHQRSSGTGEEFYDEALPSANGEQENGVGWEPKYRVVWTDPDNSSVISSDNHGDRASKERYSQSNPFMADLIGNDRVTAEDHFQETRLLRFSTPPSAGIDFLPGDVVYIQPRNLDESITEFLSFLEHFDHDRPFDLLPVDPSGCIRRPALLFSTSSNSPASLRRCAEFYFDIQSVPRRSFFAMLAHFAPPDSLEKEKLSEFSSSEGQEDYFSYCTRPRRTIVETMRDFPQTVRRVPLDYWFDLIGPIRPRAFSIASCLDTHPNEIQILMAVVRYKTRLYGDRLGVCTNWLSRLPVNSATTKVPIWVRKGTIEFRFDSTTNSSTNSQPPPPPPCIMVGPGTGVAPFRSYLHWRANRGFTENILFFGCRNEMKDFYFRHEFTQMLEKGCLRLFAVAFSRDSQSSAVGSKVYVQHRIRENGPAIAAMIVNEGAQFFVAGNAKQMPKDVLEALKDVLKQYYASNAEDRGNDDLDHFVDQYVSNMEKEKRLQMETWS